MPAVPVRRAVTAAVWTAAALSVVTLTACSASRGSAPAAPASIPVSLQAPAGQTLWLKARAVGVQIYVCQAGQDSGHYDWVLEAPEAQLVDSSGKVVIKHFAGPSWQATDGSTVVGEVVARDPGPDPMAIPWLLLRVKSSSGTGVLSGVQSVQRINTLGGKPPAGGCAADLAGSRVRAQYTAEYRFYKARG